MAATVEIVAFTASAMRFAMSMSISAYLSSSARVAFLAFSALSRRRMASWDQINRPIIAPTPNDATATSIEINMSLLMAHLCRKIFALVVLRRYSVHLPFTYNSSTD